MRQLDGGVKDFLIECNGVSHPPVWPFMADDYWAFTGDREALRIAFEAGRKEPILMGCHLDRHGRAGQDARGVRDGWRCLRVLQLSRAGPLVPEEEGEEQEHRPLPRLPRSHPAQQYKPAANQLALLAPP